MPRLRRTSPDDSGWTRRRAGVSSTGRDLAIPPAWEDVWICPVENGHLQTVGADEAGRRRYLYHPAWREPRDSEKHTRVLGFGKVLPKAREQVLRDLRARKLSRARACAVAVRLLDLGYFRIGNDVYAGRHGNFGLTTLERRHVRRQVIGRCSRSPGGRGSSTGSR